MARPTLSIVEIPRSYMRQWVRDDQPEHLQ